MTSPLPNKTVFWARVQGHLDERRDPLEDADIQQFLLDHPALLEPFAQLQSSLRSLAPGTTEQGVRTGKRRAGVVAVALLLVLGFLSYLPGLAPTPMPELAEDTRVLGWDVQVVTTSPGVREELRFEPGNLTDQIIETVTFQPTGFTSLQGVHLQVSSIRTNSQ